MKKKEKKVIVKEVCLDCKDEVSKILTNTTNEVKMAGAEFNCEWCDVVIPKFGRHIVFYELKERK